MHVRAAARARAVFSNAYRHELQSYNYTRAALSGARHVAMRGNVQLTSKYTSEHPRRWRNE
jgi:hypothetical protein